MALPPSRVAQVLAEANKPLGVQEIIRIAGLHPGQQTEVKRALRELVRSGEVEKEGKRFFVPPPGRGARVPGQPRPTVQVDRINPRPAGADRGRGRVQSVAGSNVQRGAGPGFQQGRGRPGGGQRGGAPAQARGWNPSRSAGGRSSRGEVLEGILRAHRDGFGFVHLDDDERENVFLPPFEARKALDGDRVRVELVQKAGRGEGRLVEVLTRRRENVAGTYVLRAGESFVIPKDSNLPGVIRVPPTQLAQDGDLVKVRLATGVEMLTPGESLAGEVAGSLGKPGDPSGEVLSIAFGQGFNDEFPPEVMEESERVPLHVSTEEAAGEGRRDLRAMPLVTIDGEDARDFDDAVYVEPTAHGYRLVVAIADVTHYVREHTALDREALSRATSVYLPNRVLPMLPERLSAGICSLKPDEDRLCMVAEMNFDRAGRVRDSELYPAVMRSHARCTYNEVQAVLDGQDVPHRNAFKPHFQNLLELSRVLHKMREKRGAIDFDLPEYKIALGADGLPVRMEKRARQDSHRLIEECMLAANEAVAKFFQDEGLPSIYRYHGDPDEEKLAAFADLAAAHGFFLNKSGQGEISSKDLSALLKQLADHPEARTLNQLLLRSMMQAVYSAENVGHYGLAAEFYLHFTSPIRRYPDLVVHRLLKKHWARAGKPSEAELERETARLEEMAVQSSERERAAMHAERDVVSYYSVLMMKDRVGEEFQCTVSSVVDFGFFIEVDSEHVEGLVKGESLGWGFKLDTKLHALVYPNGRRVRVGQKLRARLGSVNLERRQMDFEVLAFEGEQDLPARVPGDGRGEQRPSRREHGGRSSRHERPRPQREVSRAQPEMAPVRRQPAAPESAPSQRRPHAETHPSREQYRLQREAREAFRPALETTPVAQVEAPAKLAGARVEEPEPHEAEVASPHPGFDRLRALAAKHKGVRAEPVRQAPVRAEPVKQEPVRAEPVKQEPVRAEPVKQEPVRAEPVKQEPVRAEPAKQEPVRAEPVKEEPVRAEPAKEAPVRVEPAKEAPSRRRSERPSRELKTGKVVGGTAAVAKGGKKEPASKVKDTGKKAPAPKAKDSGKKVPAPKAKDSGKKVPAPKAKDSGKKVPAPKAKGSGKKGGAKDSAKKGSATGKVSSTGKVSAAKKDAAKKGGTKDLVKKRR